MPSSITTNRGSFDIEDASVLGVDRARTEMRIVLSLARLFTFNAQAVDQSALLENPVLVFSGFLEERAEKYVGNGVAVGTS